MSRYICHFHNFSSGKLYYTDVMEMLRDIDPPLGFGKDCPERQAYKRLIRMNMPMDQEGKVIYFDLNLATWQRCQLKERDASMILMVGYNITLNIYQVLMFHL